MMVLNMDCLVGMREHLADESVDAVVCDPPYGIAFMARKWDYDVPSEAIWAECLRVLKPGAHLIAFSGARTYHRMAVRIEDAGFEIRDMGAWLYGSGFPRGQQLKGEHEGWGTTLKPAHEPFVMARKPFKGSVTGNMQTHGTGALNIEACRVEGGRWPANIIHDGSPAVVEIFPENAGAAAPVRGTEQSEVTNGIYGKYNGRVPGQFYGDKGSASRFFYCAKASRSDRNFGLDDPGPQFIHGSTLRQIENTATSGNNHPTVKPIALMRHLIELVTPAGGRVLDPFAGSGSTGVAAIQGGFGFVGFELDAHFAGIAARRIEAAHNA